MYVCMYVYRMNIRMVDTYVCMYVRTYKYVDMYEHVIQGDHNHTTFLMLTSDMGC